MPAFASVLTNDTFASREWYLDAIGARDAWQSSTGSRDVIVAVIDSGIDIDHEDLRENIWTNEREIPNNGLDDDGNGYPDDVHGWNFMTSKPDVRPTPSASGSMEAWIHGTAVASIIAGHGNNDVGITGVAWRARIMPLVILDANGTGGDEHLIRAIRYAVAHGADIINLSLVGYESNPDLTDVIHEATAQGVLVVTAAGNGERESGENLDELPGFPACDKGAANVGEITVTSVDRLNQKASKANFGTCVDISAPGVDVFAARPPMNLRDGQTPEAGYTGGLSGTSVAAPIVSGVAVLLKAAHPDWRGPELAARLLETVDPIDEKNPALVGKLGRGRVNAARALGSADAVRYGPIALESSSPGYAPFIRILRATSTEPIVIPVGESGDRRGIRSRFLRWQGDLEPDIAVSTIGDSDGSWRVYRPDGLLVAAGAVGPNVRGGLLLAAEDVDSDGRDELLLSEADGDRAWLVTSKGDATEFHPFGTAKVQGIMALSVARPVPAFFVASIAGEALLAVYGKNLERFSTSRLPSDFVAFERALRAGERRGNSNIIDIRAGARRIVYVETPTGFDQTAEAISLRRWTQSPTGELRGAWIRTDVWPR